ncbi:hypothetical protein BDR26DRAFT_893381 [Obelidium mucronatum]|nr:hypothetical protein BDR26DRAFT_893381 [Obelidium mucronatum]
MEHDAPIPLFSSKHKGATKYHRPPYVARLPEKEYNKARALALTEKTDTQLLLDKMQEEKKALHQKSQHMVKKWTNTVLGQRAKRLAFQAEKDRLAEQERNRIDAEWHVLQTQERKERVEKARMMQYMTMPQMRALKDQMNLSNVLHERDLQIEHKKKLDALLKSHEYDETEALRRDKEAEIRQLVKAELDHRARLKCAAEQREQAKKEFLIKLKEREAEREFQSKIDRQINEEIAIEKAQAQAARRELVKNTNIELQKNIEDRKKTRAAIKSSDDDLYYVNDHFNEMQAKVQATKKQRENQKNAHKAEIFEKVSNLNVKLNTEHDGKLEDFRFKLEHAHEGDFERKEAEKQRKRDARIAEINEYRRLKIKEREANEEAEKLDGIHTREVHEQYKIEFEQDNLQRAITRSNRLRDLKNAHLQQIKEKKQTDEKHHAEMKQLERSFNQAIIDDNLKFEKYAKDAIQEFQAEGKNVVPIMRGVLRKSLPFPSCTHFKNINTYRRLGFVVRYMPVESKELDPWHNRKANANPKAAMDRVINNSSQSNHAK